MQDFRPDDDLRLNRSTRIAKRPSHSPKKGKSLQIYLFIGLGILILVGLISALWLILREPTIKPTTESYNTNNTAGGQLDLGALTSSQTTYESNTLNTSSVTGSDTNNNNNNQITLPTANELPEITASGESNTSTPTLSQTTNNIESSPSTLTSNTHSTLPLDYATAGNQSVAKQTALNSNSTNNSSTSQTATTAKNTTQQPVTAKTVEPLTTEPRASEPKANAPQNTETKTAQSQAIVPERNIEPAKPVTQNTTQNKQPSTDFTQPPKPVEQPKPQPKPEITQPAKNTAITPQTATIKNSQPNVANSRPLPPPTIQQQEILANANGAQESAAALQTQIQNGTKTANTQASPVTANNTKPAARPRQSGPINNGSGGNFTIQVASASRAEGLRKLAASKGLLTARVIETERNGGKWYILITGNYGSRQEAQRAISTLPVELQSNGAWVRQK